MIERSDRQEIMLHIRVRLKSTDKLAHITNKRIFDKELKKNFFQREKRVVVSYIKTTKCSSC